MSPAEMMAAKESAAEFDISELLVVLAWELIFSL